MDDSNFKELKIKAAKELKFIDDIERQRNMFENGINQFMDLVH